MDRLVEERRYVEVDTETSTFCYEEIGKERLFFVVMRNMKTQEIFVTVINCHDKTLVPKLAVDAMDQQEKEKTQVLLVLGAVDLLEEYSTYVDNALTNH